MTRAWSPHFLTHGASYPKLHTRWLVDAVGRTHRLPVCNVEGNDISVLPKLTFNPNCSSEAPSSPDTHLIYPAWTPELHYYEQIPAF